MSKLSFINEETASRRGKGYGQAWRQPAYILPVASEYWYKLLFKTSPDLYFLYDAGWASGFTVNGHEPPKLTMR